MDAKYDLDAALEKLYGTFSRYPLPEDSVACDHCVAPEELVRCFPHTMDNGEEWHVSLDRWLRGTAPIRIIEGALPSAGSAEVAEELRDGLRSHIWWGWEGEIPADADDL
ncbi:hypothetical protein GCM10010517_16900 [Streptosporangium fragile]|uniref:CdiI immunity protein domain-containing protein n=1 Tax=Streptosporangium fragile TaxID=46186 RepID=A0ABP6I9D4_9ACTN